MISIRIRKLREQEGYSRRDMEKKTGIPEYTWEAIETGKQAVKEEHIMAAAKLWPTFKYWLVFGETAPEVGQIRPPGADQ